MDFAFISLSSSFGIATRGCEDQAALVRINECCITSSPLKIAWGGHSWLPTIGRLESVLHVFIQPVVIRRLLTNSSPVLMRVLLSAPMNRGPTALRISGRRTRELARGGGCPLQPLDGLARQRRDRKRMAIRSADGSARSVRAINV
jgi:hypothetical protein